jgi:hypothetical protein
MAAAATKIIGSAVDSFSVAHGVSPKITDLPEFSRVFRGRELTFKHRRLASGLARVDHLIGGGIVRGRISEIVGATGSGKTSLAMAFAAQVTRFEAAAWIETGDHLDPASLIAAGVEPARMLWVSCRRPNLPARLNGAIIPKDEHALGARRDGEWRRLPLVSLKVTEWILAVGGFGLIVIDCGTAIRFLPQSVALRLARAAERSGAALIILAEQRLCGTFAALSLALHCAQVCFSPTHRGAPATFDGQVIEARVMRNKLGGAGDATHWMAAIDPLSAAPTLGLERFADSAATLLRPRLADSAAPSAAGGS